MLKITFLLVFLRFHAKLLRSKILEEAIVTEIYHRTKCKKLIAFLSVALKKKKLVIK